MMMTSGFSAAVCELEKMECRIQMGTSLSIWNVSSLAPAFLLLQLLGWLGNGNESLWVHRKQIQHA